MTETINLFKQGVLLKNKIEDLQILLKVELNKKESDKTRNEDSVRGLLHQKGNELTKLKVFFSKMMLDKFYEMDPLKFKFLKFESSGIWGRNIGEELFFVIANIFFENHLYQCKSTFVFFNCFFVEFLKGINFKNYQVAVAEITNIFSKEYLEEGKKFSIFLVKIENCHSSFKFDFKWD